MDMLDIDPEGLDEGDRRILSTIVDFFSGGPVGLSTIAAALNEDPQTIEDIYEPYLLQKGLLERTPRGRRVTAGAYSYLGRKVPADAATMLLPLDELQ
jgi:Holliday junction DNA helicase RuvB